MARRTLQKVPEELWRISNHADLSGAGGLRYAARWNTAGRPIVYLAETPAGALLEVLVHLELEEAALPRHYQLLRVAVDPSTVVEELGVPDGTRWKRNPVTTRALGDAWLRIGSTALARVPSAILPHTANYLLNPRHPAAVSLQILERQRARFDPRLLPLRQVKASISSS